MKTQVKTVWPVLLLGLVIAVAACSDNTRAPSDSDVSYPEGSVRMEIEYLDTGLLKGHSYAVAAAGWHAASIKVEAVDQKGAAWPVLEPERTGVNSASATEFFEVTLQELPRGQQITVTTSVVFEDEDGNTAERSASDRWPP